MVYRRNITQYTCIEQNALDFYFLFKMYMYKTSQKNKKKNWIYENNFL